MSKADNRQAQLDLKRELKLRAASRKDVLAAAKAAEKTGPVEAQQADAASRSSLLKAVPWIVGAVIAIGVVYAIVKKRRS